MRLSKKINRETHKIISILVDDIKLHHYGLIFFSVIFFLGFLYYVLTPYSNGIGNNGKPLANLSFFNAVYFSVVTVSSLGYGDMHPMGISKLIAIVEVLFGLAIMGVMIAKLTSARISHHVSRLYISELQKRLEEFSSDFDKTVDGLRSCMRAVGNSFQNTPSSSEDTNSSMIVQQCSTQLSFFHGRSVDFKEYIEEEAYKGAFFGVAPPKALKKTAESIDQGLFNLGQLITSLSPEAKTVILDQQNRRHTSAIIETVKNLAEFAVENCKDDDVRDLFSQMIQKCSTIPESYYTMPEFSLEVQPDQRFEYEEEPQSDNVRQ